jgi:hypothetical protein
LLASALISFSAAVVSILSLANSCLISDIILSLCVFLTWSCHAVEFRKSEWCQW